jgi:hypothetical protein
MDSTDQEFANRSAEWMQTRFFLGQSPDEGSNLLWPSHPGRYRFRELGLVAEPNSVILFQFQSHIIASAALVWVEHYSQPDGQCSGAFWFDPPSVRVFYPVDVDGMRRIWGTDFVFSNVRQTLDRSRYLGFVSQLRGVAAPVLLGDGR